MQLRLDVEQVETAIRDYLADPGQDSGAVAIRIPDNMPIRVSAARVGGLTVYTGEDAIRRMPKTEAAKRPGPADIETRPRLSPTPPVPADSTSNGGKGKDGYGTDA